MFGRIYEALKTPEAYAVYRDCMFRPTQGKFLALADALLADPRASVWAYRRDGRLAGILAVLSGEEGAEIVGIAVDSRLRGRGIGSYMVREAMRRLPAQRLAAETDGDGVGFYRKCGFEVEEATRTYDGEPYTRYHCVLTA